MAISPNKAAKPRSKPTATVHVQETNASAAEYSGSDHTQNDRSDMRRMGKKQELRRNFRFPTILSFVCLAMGTWEIILSATASGLANGGTAGQIWMFVGSFFCFGTIVLSLAEMSSMAPTAGGQYHWASEFAPPKYQKFTSYMSGWMSTLSWQCGTCSGMFLLGGQVQELARITYPSYGGTTWQAYLIVVGMVTIGLIVNTWCAKQLPLIEGLLLVLHLCGWVVIMAVLWAMAPKITAHDVFTNFQINSGWSPIGLGMLVGQVVTIYGLIGSDGAAHLAEETSDAGIVVPRCMIWSYLLNCSLGFVMLVTYCFCITDVEAALNGGGGFRESSLAVMFHPKILVGQGADNTAAYIYVFQQATGSVAGATGLTCIILVLGVAGATSFFTSASRQTFAFARDKGLPGNRWIGKVDARKLIPLNSILVTYAFTVLLSLINLGSTTAFNAIIGLQLIALMSTYAISIGCLALRRLQPDSSRPLPFARWSLGRFGLPINLFAFAYACFAMVFVLFPTMQPVTLSSMNWAVVMWFGVLAIALVYYVVHGRKVYDGPVAFVKTGPATELQ